MRALLKKPALLSILCATVETFKKESLLFILGHTKNENFIIEYAVPMQTAKRNFKLVENKDYRKKLIMELSTFLWKNSQIIGDAHSHAEFGENQYAAQPSKEDENDAKKDKVYIILEISTKKKAQKWQKTKRRGILGTLGKYKFEINAFWAPEDKKLEQIPLICSSAYRLNAFKK